jgi:sulfite exporter TauE/SafE
LINLPTDLSTFLPWVSLVAGVGGSLHCVGMCGGLVTATCEGSKDVMRYQLGRLLGYLSLGIVAGTLGSFLKFEERPLYVSLIPGLLVGIIFLYWGIQNFRGKKAEMPTPKFLSRLYQNLWLKLVAKNKNFSKAFFTGLISIFLPCGLLYGVLLGTVSLEHRHEAMISMLFFWLGTLPSMVLAPAIVQKLIRPLKAKLPRAFGVGLMVLGISTISVRMVKMHDFYNSEHDKAVVKKSCH